MATFCIMALILYYKKQKHFGLQNILKRNFNLLPIQQDVVKHQQSCKLTKN
jgi:hypothetical protein